MQSTGPSPLDMLLPFIGMFAIFYFLIIRPQGRKLKDHEKFINGLKRGDEVVTTSGILGIVDGLSEQVVTLDVASGVKIKILKKQIAGTQLAMIATGASNKK